MFDAAAARRRMVDGQIRTADVTDRELIEAMLSIPRERFVPPALAPLAYLDNDLGIGDGRALLKPVVLAKLVQAADVDKQSRVLDVGCGSGYSAAILARIAGTVIALEEEQDLARQARDALGAVGAKVEVALGSLAEGWAAGGPYDVILLNGACEVVPDVYARQLKPNGRLACVYGRPPASKATIFRLAEGRLVGRPVFDAAALMLPGFVAPAAFVF